MARGGIASRHADLVVVPLVIAPVVEAGTERDGQRIGHRHDVLHEQPDALLVAPRGASQDVRLLVERLKGEGAPEIAGPRD